MHVMNSGFSAAILAAGLVAGCGAAQAPGAPHGSTALELVLMQKPDTVEGYAKLRLAYYDLCVASARINHLEVKPLPAFPATLGATRTTYLFRGRDVVIRIEGLTDLDITKMQPEQGCEVAVAAATRLNVDMQIGDMHTSITSDEDGRPLVQSEDNGNLMRMDASMPSDSTAGYSEPITLNGIELRCLPKTDPIISSGFAQQACVYGRDGIVPEPDGKVILLATRGKPFPNSPYTMVTEPESLRLIEHPDPKLFSAANYTP
jgi:hypothetical protein